MKKLFIGCGIAVLLLLGGLGALVWSFWDDIQLLRTQADSAMQRIEAVEAAWPFSAEGLQQLDGERFVRVMPLSDPATLEDGFFDVQACNDTNRVDLFVFANDSQVLLVSRLDNLGKGASGAAVQCMNLHLGCDEGLGL